jgi:hypothetical protein
MGIEIEMTGSGELGPLASGWSVQEYATPVTIGNTAGGTGNVSFTAAARDDSLFIINNNITTTEQTLGSVTGVVKSVSQSGLNVNVSHDTRLALLDATADIPALGAGGMYSALDLCSQISGRDKLLGKYNNEPRDGYFYSMRGHSAGFDKDGNPVETIINDGSYNILSTATSRTLTLACTTTAGSATVKTSNTVGLVVGATLTATANIPSGRTIASIVDSTTFTINSGTSVTAGTGVATTFTISVTPFLYPVFYREYYGRIWADSFKVLSGDVWATHTLGDCFSNNKGIRTSRLAFKSLLNGQNLSWGFDGLPDDSNTGSGQSIGLDVNYSTGAMTLSGYYRYGGLRSNFSQTFNLSTILDKNAELAFFIEYTRPFNVSGGNYVITVKACNTSDYSVVATLTQTINADISYYNTPWEITGNVRSIYRHQGNSLTDWVAEYENPVTFMVMGSIGIDGAVTAQSKANMWEYLQQACAAYDKELSLVEGTIIVREVGSHAIDITNSTTPTISPNTSMGGRSVEVVYSNATSIVSQEIYNAKDDNNRVLSVKAGEKITTTVEVKGTPTVVNLPVRTTGVGALNGIGQYSIVDSSGVKVPQETWAKYGGRVDVSLSTTAFNAIDITLTGPYSTDGVFNKTTIGGTDAAELYPSPYKLAFTADGTDYAALSVTASGIKSIPSTLKIRTAADPEKVAQDVAKTIVNPFIINKKQAYDRGEWAIVEASGPRVTVSTTVPVGAIESFGYGAGALFHYRDSIYRVTDATIGNLSASINSTRHVRVGDFDAIWAGHTVGTHDTMWAGYDTSDQVIAPLRFIGDNESVMMFLDTDVNPYYDLTGNPEISVFPDTDANPYYEEGGNLEGEDPVYLDTDENPYDGGNGYGS